MTKKEFDKASSNDVAKYFQCWCLLTGSATQRREVLCNIIAAGLVKLLLCHGLAL